SPLRTRRRRNVPDTRHSTPDSKGIISTDMQLDRLTTKSQEALQEAQRIARGYAHQEVDGEHLLLAMIGQGESLIPDLLEKIGVPGAKLKPELERELARRHKVQGISSSDLF